ncbi:MAG: DUF1364 domain-containing protein [Pantoea sp.]|uniref:DUF1364 domain-containing protein n=1 Tax=Pantoea sp. TaxID=69393 RepID=UPI00121CED39|nr:DUF1364 domain-containing protein [Pantoea sp.]RZK07194.1 MAG: DUF1364 domain-containing protein [Pantoea sp.]
MKKNLRKATRGRECTIRIPGVCNFNPESSVLTHYRLGGLCGTGIKPSDLVAAIGCDCCHAAVDGRLRTEFTHEELRLMHAEGVLRTLDIWEREGFIS